MIQRLICLAIGYVCGLFQTGYIVGRAKGIDIREHGSGNAGTTNTVRTMGLKYGLITLFGDIVKCGVAIIITRLLYANTNSEILPILLIYAASGAILGHNFPFYMKFKGGKGMAATAGFVIFGLQPWMTLICFTVFATIFATTHYVSLGAICVYFTLLLSALFYWKFDLFNFTANGLENCYMEYAIIMLLLTIMVIVRHKENIKRLIAGNERKTYLKSRPILDVDNNNQGDGE